MNENEYDFTGIGSAPDGVGGDPDHLASYSQAPEGPKIESLGDLTGGGLGMAGDAVQGECRACASVQGGTNFDSRVDEIFSENPTKTDAEDFNTPYSEEIPGTFMSDGMGRVWKDTDNVSPDRNNRNGSNDRDDYPLSVSSDD